MHYSKKKTKVFVLIVCVLSLLLTNIIRIKALDCTSITISEPTTSTTNVTNVTNSKYTVMIPKQILLSSSKRTNYSVRVSGDISSNEYVTVKPETDSFKMKDTFGGKADVTADLSPSRLEWSCQDLKVGYTSILNTITADKLSAGRWKGIFNFLIQTNKLDSAITEATLVDGISFNQKLRELEQTNPNSNLKTAIASITWENSLPTNKDTVIMSIPNSVPIYAWIEWEKRNNDFDGKEWMAGSVKLYTSANKIYMNEDARYLLASNIERLFVDANIDAILKEEFSGLKFANTYNLGSIEFLNRIDTSRTKNMKGMFFYTGTNATLETIQFTSNFNTSNVTDMSYMFEGTGGFRLESIDLGPNFNTSNVTNMDQMFCGTGIYSLKCLNLRENFDTSNVVNMNCMFFETGYHSLEYLNLGNKFHTGKVENMNEMFRELGFRTLKTLELGPAFTSLAPKTAHMFKDCGINNTTIVTISDESLYNKTLQQKETLDAKIEFTYAN